MLWQQHTQMHMSFLIECMTYIAGARSAGSPSHLEKMTPTDHLSDRQQPIFLCAWYALCLWQILKMQYAPASSQHEHCYHLNENVIGP